MSAGVGLRPAERWYRRHLEAKRWRVRSFWDERVSGNPPPGVQVIGRRAKALVEVLLDESGRTVEARVIADYLGNELCHSRTQSGCW